MPRLASLDQGRVAYIHTATGAQASMNEDCSIPVGYVRQDGRPRYASLLDAGVPYEAILNAERQGNDIDLPALFAGNSPQPGPPPVAPTVSATSASYIPSGTYTTDWATFDDTSNRPDFARISEQMRSYTPRVSLRTTAAPRRESRMDEEITGTVLDFFTPLYKIQGRKPEYSENKKESYIGLELENEAQREFDTPTVSGWRYHDEGSLRNFGFEYVQSEPAPVKESKRRVGVLLRALKREMGDQTCLNSIRTSVHVHFDVLHYTYLDIMNFSLVYWLLEGFVSHFCGDSRKGNLFCLRLKDASVAQQMITQAIDMRQPYSSDLLSDNYRYASLNLASIQKFGSLEFRIMRGTDNLDDVTTWVDTLESIKQFALKFNTPADLREFFLSPKNPAEDLPRVVFGEGLYYKLLSHVKDKSRIGNDIRDAFMTVSPILQAHTDFKFSDEIEPAKKTLEDQKKRREEEIRAREAAIEAARISAAEETGEDEIADDADHYVFSGERMEFVETEGDL